MADEWNSYICNVNSKLASIYLNLGLRPNVPIPNKSWLLWVWVYFESPRTDGLSDSNEAPILYKIEDELDAQMQPRCGAILSGRITTQGRREFYYYGEHCEAFEDCIADVRDKFRDYRISFGLQEDRNWNQYLTVLYPPDEELQKMRNRNVLDVLEREGDNHAIVREVTHWVYFEAETDREQFHTAITHLGYMTRESVGGKAPRPFGLTFFRKQAVTAEEIDKSVIELFRIAQQHRAEYDGWETSVEKG